MTFHEFEIFASQVTLLLDLLKLIQLSQTNSNSNKYYTFTFDDTEDISGDFNIPVKEEILRGDRSFSPVKIYIET